MNDTPFKERYQRIPPHQYEEVKKHLKEMIEIGAIQKSASPWDSVVVLVRKKDGSPRFYINLRKLNARAIKDAYNLPSIEDSLDCLNGVQIFTSLDLKSGYWLIEFCQMRVFLLLLLLLDHWNFMNVHACLLVSQMHLQLLSN